MANGIYESARTYGILKKYLHTFCPENKALTRTQKNKNKNKILNLITLAETSVSIVLSINI